MKLDNPLDNAAESIIWSSAIIHKQPKPNAIAFLFSFIVKCWFLKTIGICYKKIITAPCNSFLAHTTNKENSMEKLLRPSKFSLVLAGGILYGFVLLGTLAMKVLDDYNTGEIAITLSIICSSSVVFLEGPEKSESPA